MMNDYPPVFRDVIRDHGELRSAFGMLISSGMNAGEQDFEAVVEIAASLRKRLREIDRLVERHVQKEEKGIFPVLRTPLSAGEETGNTLFEVLEAEHRHLEKALASLTNMCEELVSGGDVSSELVDLLVTKLRIVQAEFIAHFMKEEKGVYSRAGMVLTEEDVANIERTLDSL